MSLRKNIFACLFSVRSIKKLSRQVQECLVSSRDTSSIIGPQNVTSSQNVFLET